jgi:hypothetical protein
MEACVSRQQYIDSKFQLNHHPLQIRVESRNTDGLQRAVTLVWTADSGSQWHPAKCNTKSRIQLYLPRGNTNYT